MGTPTTDVSDDETAFAAGTQSAYHRVARSPRRRTILEVLEADEVPVALEDLAAAVREREPDDATERTVRIALHHVHLPVLDDAGFLEYDPDDREVGRLLVVSP